MVKAVAEPGAAAAAEPATSKAARAKKDKKDKKSTLALLKQQFPVMAPPSEPFDPFDETLVTQVCDACISAKQQCDFHPLQWASESPPRRCLSCEHLGNVCHTRKCTACYKTKSRHDYLTTQWFNNKRRCNHCLLAAQGSIYVGGPPKTAPVASLEYYLQCSECGTRKGQHSFSAGSVGVDLKLSAAA